MSEEVATPTIPAPIEPEERPTLEALLSTISGQLTETNGRIDTMTSGLSSQIAGVGSIASQALTIASQAHQLATQATARIGSLPPPTSTPPPAVDGAGAALPPVTIIQRVSSQEGTINDVIGRLVALEGSAAKAADVDAVRTQIGDVKGLLAQQNRVAGIAGEAESLARKFYTFVKSREGANFAMRLATLIAIGYGAFQVQQKLQAVPPPREPAPFLAPPTSP